MSKNFLDIASLFSDNPQHTWSNGIQSSRIDQIWISPSLSLTPISFKTIDITPFYNADHKLIICSFEISNLTSQPTTHSIKTNTCSRQIFNYSATTFEQWTKFANKIDLMIEKSKLKFLIQQPKSLNNINSIWQEFSKIIISAANETLPTKKVSPHATPHRPLVNTSLFKQHCKITHLLSSLHSFKQSTPLPIKWHTTFCSIKTIAFLHNYTFPSFILFNTEVLENIINLTKLLNIHFDKTVS
ncbi:17122_t:CDS:1 [Entrophospora sp. SA101]|nr:17122_t:CDS:1 [Entrophospora sp. SA101]